MLEERREPEPVVRRVVGEDAVVVVRRAMEQAEAGVPLFGQEQPRVKAAVVTLEERLRRLQARGGEFGEIALSGYARRLMPGGGPMTLAS